MPTDETSETRFPAGRGFILQFKSAGKTDEPVFAGRIEHIVSGNVQYFFSAEELYNALRTMLSNVPDSDK